jgi:hypothetical protein
VIPSNQELSVHKSESFKCIDSKQVFREVKMATTRKAIGIFVAAIFLVVLVAPVNADWDPGDDYKMHYPQLPNATGWTVACSYNDIVPTTATLGDDWLCTETGLVTDIHIWGAWNIYTPLENATFQLEIREDNRSGTYSKPGGRVWMKNISFGEYTVRQDPNLRDWQGWYDPSYSIIELNHHNITYQYNFDIDPAEAFVQEKDNIYWLVVSANLSGDQAQWGWKTSSMHFEDDAVFWNESIREWSELRAPRTRESLDLAFVITGEPQPSPPPQPSPVSALTTIGLLALASLLSAIAAVAIIRKRR